MPRGSKRKRSDATAKERILEYVPDGRPDEDKLPAALEAFLTWLPEGGRESLARDITNAADDQALHQVYHNLTGLAVPSESKPRLDLADITNETTGIVKARSTAPSVTASPHAKRQENADAVASTLDKPVSRDAKFREFCLRRDGYRCVVTGEMDTAHWIKIDCPTDVVSFPAEVAHIIPFSYASWDKSAVIYP